MQLYLRKLHALYIWLLAALTDVGVAMPWILLLYWGFAGPGWSRAIPGIWLALAVYGAAALWEAGDRTDNEAPGRRRLLALVAGVAIAYTVAYFLLPGSMRTGLLGANPALSYVPAALYLWYVGALTMTHGLTYARLFPRYPYQCAGTAVGVAVLAKLGGLADPGVRVLLYWSVMLVLACGLLALVGSREQMLKAGQAGMGEKATGNSGLERILGFVVLGLVVLTLSASYVVTSDRLGAFTASVVHGFEAVWNTMAALVWLIVGKYAYLIGQVLEWAIYGLRLLMHPLKPQNPDSGEVATGKPTTRFQHVIERPWMDWSPYLKVGIFTVSLIVLLVLIYKLTYRKRPPQEDGEEEIVDLGFWPNLRADLKGLFGTRRPAAVDAQSMAERLDSRDPRMLFRRLQAWGAAMGRPREAGETPNAYEHALGEVRPEDAAAAGAVTATYNQARYGATPPAAADVDVAAGAVEQLEKAQFPKP
jgi:hypothetical protein